MGDTVKLSAGAERLMQELIVQRGLSYKDAIRELERGAVAAASPYKEAAGLLRERLSDG